MRHHITDQDKNANRNTFGGKLISLSVYLHNEIPLVVFNPARLIENCKILLHEKETFAGWHCRPLYIIMAIHRTFQVP